MKFMTLDERKAAIAEIRKTSVTEAEAAVWAHIALGKTNKEIAGLRGSSAKTVDNQRTHLFRKIGARNAADATRLAIERGVIKIQIQGESNS